MSAQNTQDNRRAPMLAEDDVLLWDEPGRVVGNTCYSAFHLRLVRRGSSFYILVKHGGGQERLHLEGLYSDVILSQWSALPDDARYMLLFTFYDTAKRRAQNAASAKFHEMAQAFVSGTLKKRKQRGSAQVKVWIEEPA